MVTEVKEKHHLDGRSCYWSLVSWDRGTKEIDGDLDKKLVNYLLMLKNDLPNLEIVMCCESPGKSITVSVEDGTIQNNKFKSKIPKILVKGRGKKYPKKDVTAIVIMPSLFGDGKVTFYEKVWKAWGTGVWGSVTNVAYKRNPNVEFEQKASLKRSLAIGAYDNKTSVFGSGRSGLSYIKIHDKKNKRVQEILGNGAEEKLLFLTTALSRAMTHLAPLFRSEFSDSESEPLHLTASTFTHGLYAYAGQYTDWNAVTFFEPPPLDMCLMSGFMSSIGIYTDFELSSIQGYEKPGCELKLKTIVNVIRNKVPDHNKIYKQHVLLIGDYNVGKTTMIDTFNSFEKDAPISTTIGVELRDMRVRLNPKILEKYAPKQYIKKTNNLIAQGKEEIGLLTRDVGGQNPKWMYHLLPSLPNYSPWWVGLVISSHPDEYENSVKALDERLSKICKFEYKNDVGGMCRIPWDSYSKHIFMTKKDIPCSINLSGNEKKELMERYGAVSFFELSKNDIDTVYKAIYTASLHSL